jgi:hypothetical protein
MWNCGSRQPHDCHIANEEILIITFFQIIIITLLIECDEKVLTYTSKLYLMW